MATPVKHIASSDAQEISPAATRATTGSKSATGQSTPIEARLNLAGEDRRQLIAEAAYFRAEQRGFHPGAELDDWLAAELEIDALLGADDTRT